MDLLVFHVEQLRYVVMELKTMKFDPRDAGQLGFYVALAGSAQPVAVSRYQLTAEAQKALPNEEALARAFTDELQR